MVLRPIRRFAKRPRKWIASSSRENFDLLCVEEMVPQASSWERVMEQGRLYFLAIRWKLVTRRASSPRPRRYFGVSRRRITVIRRMDRMRTRPPLVYIR